MKWIGLIAAFVIIFSAAGLISEGIKRKIKTTPMKILVCYQYLNSNGTYSVGNSTVELTYFDSQAIEELRVNIRGHLNLPAAQEIVFTSITRLDPDRRDYK